jgi:two-component system OmpR family response regulator
MKDPRTKVLCIDDNVDAADSTAELLRLSGFDARPCHGPEEAMLELSSFAPDVCLIDLSMPGTDGDVLAGRLCAASAGPLRCIALTALWDVDSRHRTNNAGFERHLVKPVEAGRLLAAVRGPE